MDVIEDYRSNAHEAPILRKWFLRAFIASLALHLGLVIFFRATRLERFDSAPLERLVPRTFTVGRAEIDPKLFQPDPAEDPAASGKMPAERPNINLPAEQPSADQMPREIHAVPEVPELANPITTDKPRPDASALKTLQRMQNQASESQQDLQSFQDLLQDPAKISDSALLSLSNAAAKSSGPTVGGPGTAGVGGYSNIDDLLARSGPLGDGTKPLYMPAAPLFAYNSAELQPTGVAALQKLGLLIRKHPEASYTIEGYADSTGVADYNLKLSQQRAESVKTWLVSKMGVNPSQVETRGLGSTKLVAPATGDVDAEAPNRRVEIVIKTPGTR